jgi:hypothetical protein
VEYPRPLLADEPYKLTKCPDILAKLEVTHERSYEDYPYSCILEPCYQFAT